MIIRFLALEPGSYVYPTTMDANLKRKRKALLESVKAVGMKNPVSAKTVGGETLITWGHKRAWVAETLGIPLPAIIFDLENLHSGGEIALDDIPALFSSKVTVKPPICRPEDAGRLKWS